MMRMIFKASFMVFSRLSGSGVPPPLSLTVGLTNQCNSRCETCDVWENLVHDFSAEEYEKTFQKFPAPVGWITFTGGEPFLRKDFSEIVTLAVKYLKPGVVTIPTNGILTEKIVEDVTVILKNCPRTRFVVNVSLDGVGEKHDAVRKVPGNFRKFLQTFHALKALSNPFLTVGVGTVISKYNAQGIPEILEFIKTLKPDSHVCEVAENRKELGVQNKPIAPDLTEYENAVSQAASALRVFSGYSLGRFTRALRLVYYKLSIETLRRKTQVIPCYAGFASAQLSPSGEVWECATRADSLGNLRDHDYDFMKIWKGDRARKIRVSIRKKECYCPLANASYLNMMFHPVYLFKVIWELIKPNSKTRSSQLPVPTFQLTDNR